MIHIIFLPKQDLTGETMGYKKISKELSFAASGSERLSGEQILSS